MEKLAQHQPISPALRDKDDGSVVGQSIADADQLRWQRRLDRERQARKQAEALLEQKSLELFKANQELKGVVDALEASSSRLAAILDHTFAGILVVDEQGNMIVVNRAAKAMFGRSHESVTDTCITDWLDPGSKLACEAAEASCIETTERQRSEVWHEVEGCRPDGSSFPLEFIITQLDFGDSRHQVWILRDLTQQREAEATRQALEQDLQQAQKLEALGTMAGGVAHEINTPVQFIGSNVTYLRDVFDDLISIIGCYRNLRSTALAGGDLTDPITQATKAEEEADLDLLITDVPDAIAQTEEGITRVSTIVQAFKQFAHPESDKQATIDVNSALDNTIEACRGQWRHIADLKTNYSQDLPTITGDLDRFKQVILSLVVNAAQAIEQRGGPASGLIEVRTRLDGGNIAIEIKDNGCGIPQHLQERIFEPFFTTKEVGKGTGQGLALSYKTVTENLSGAISVSSKENAGATFLVHIPAGLSA